MGVPITTEMIGDAGEIGYRVQARRLLPARARPDGRRDRRAARRRERDLARRHQSAKARSMKLGGLGSAVRDADRVAAARARARDACSRRSGTAPSSRSTHRGNARTVEPWGLSSKRGHWYVVGWDRDRGRGACVPGRSHRGRREGRATADAFDAPDRLPARRSHRGPARGCSATTSPSTVRAARSTPTTPSGALAEFRGDATVSPTEHRRRRSTSR